MLSTGDSPVSVAMFDDGNINIINCAKFEVIGP